MCPIACAARALPHCRSTTRLPVDHAHALRTAELPAHHRDPFDRLLIAQARLLDLAIITADDQLTAYDVTAIRA